MSSIWSRLINLAGNITGVLGVANGGTGLASGTSGGVLAFTASTTLASSGALTQHGVVIGGGAGAVPTSTGAGTNGQLLVGVTSADPAWGSSVSAATTFSGGLVVSGGTLTLSNIPDFEAHRSSDQTGPNNSSVDVIFNSVAFDVTSAYSNSTGIFTPAVTGKYLLAVSVILDGVPIGANAILDLFKNGSRQLRVFQELGSVGQGRKSMNAAVVVSANNTDAYKFVATTDAAGATTILGGTNQTYFSAVQVA